MIGFDRFHVSVPHSSGEGPSGRGGCTIRVSIPMYLTAAREHGNEGSQVIGWILAVKNGSVADNSSGNTSIFSGGTSTAPGPKGGVNLKRARCLHIREQPN